MNNFKHTNKAGIIYAMEEAEKYGFTYKNNEWSNLGQGSAEAGCLRNAPQRIREIKINNIQSGYAPVSGLKRLRQNVAQLYNDVFRKKMKHKYSFENINIAGGGRMVLSRFFLSIKKARLVYLVPDYAGYSGLLSAFNNLETFPVFLSEKNGFKIDLNDLEKIFIKNKIEIFLFSNPSNPTGNLLQGKELFNLIKLCKKYKVLLVVDEFYFNYIYDDKFKLVSVSEFSKNIETDNIVIISGFSKSWRYAGWRIAWVIASKKITQRLNNIGSFIDGGTSRPLQETAVSLANKHNFLQESIAIQKHFKKKRNFIIKELLNFGFIIKNKAQASFYIWASLEKMPSSLNTDFKFFKRALQEKLIVVPGRFFDINPENKKRKKRFTNYVRFSYGPNINTIKQGMKALKKIFIRN